MQSIYEAKCIYRYNFYLLSLNSLSWFRKVKLVKVAEICLRHVAIFKHLNMLLIVKKIMLIELSLQLHTLTQSIKSFLLIEIIHILGHEP